ncbi:hypothetical protein [Nocardia sp. NPDC005366]|uniref:hypothetical protein n=1 Tax=Nocardia sp. NPDC005366 TaxID=3156878 RepID=UPI0033B6CFEA
MSDTFGENRGGPAPGSGVADPVPAEQEQDTNAGDEGSGRPEGLTPYLALIITTYEATESLLATAAAAVIAVVAAIAGRR